MTIVSMKTSDDDYACSPCSSNPYGYGLEICLNAAQVEALGLVMTPPRPGVKVGLRALAFVCAVTQEQEGEEAEVEVRLRLQITDLEVTAQGADTTSSAATLLYGPGEG